MRADPRDQACKFNAWASKAAHARSGIKAVPVPLKTGEEAKEKNKATNGGSVADALHETGHAGETGETNMEAIDSSIRLSQKWTTVD